MSEDSCIHTVEAAIDAQVNLESVADVERHVRGVLVLLGGRMMGFTAREQLGVMVVALVFFHTSEFLLALAFHGRRRVNAASTLISGPYLVALACSMVEHAVESHFVPALKQQALVSYAGLAMVLLGEAIRKLAVVTANKSFTHDIKMDKRQDHKLVTHGIYRFFRHPSYLGFFIWSIGTQVLLVNPVCTVGYTIVTWRFFDHRIPYEEYFLRRFFGQDYVDYANRVPSGMPFIKSEVELLPREFTVKAVRKLSQHVEEAMGRVAWIYQGSMEPDRRSSGAGFPFQPQKHSPTRYPHQSEHGLIC